MGFVEQNTPSSNSGGKIPNGLVIYTPWNSHFRTWNLINLEDFLPLLLGHRPILRGLLGCKWQTSITNMPKNTLTSCRCPQKEWSLFDMEIFQKHMSVLDTLKAPFSSIFMKQHHVLILLKFRDHQKVSHQKVSSRISAVVSYTSSLHVNISVLSRRKKNTDEIG